MMIRELEDRIKIQDLDGMQASLMIRELEDRMAKIKEETDAKISETRSVIDGLSGLTDSMTGLTALTGQMESQKSDFMSLKEMIRKQDVEMLAKHELYSKVLQEPNPNPNPNPNLNSIAKCSRSLSSY